LKLAPGQPDHAPAGDLKRPVSRSIALERLARAVGGEAVAFDDELVLGPDGIELAVGGVAVDLRPRQSVGVDEGDQRGLEVASGARLAVLAVVLEDAPDRLRPAASRVAREEGIKGHRARQPAVLGLVERGLELVRRDDGGEVEQRARRRRDADAGLDADFVVLQLDVVDLQPRGAAAVARDADIDPRTRVVADPPERGGRAVAQRRARAGGQHC
jgi:hypothetical protein